jgi:hypothetical protein
MKYVRHLWHSVTASLAAFVIWALMQGSGIEAAAIVTAFILIEACLEFTRE